MKEEITVFVHEDENVKMTLVPIGKTEEEKRREKNASDVDWAAPIGTPIPEKSGRVVKTGYTTKRKKKPWE